MNDSAHIPPALKSCTYGEYAKARDSMTDWSDDIRFFGRGPDGKNPPRYCSHVVQVGGRWHHGSITDLNGIEPARYFVA